MIDSLPYRSDVANLLSTNDRSEADDMLTVPFYDTPFCVRKRICYILRHRTVLDTNLEHTAILNLAAILNAISEVTAILRCGYIISCIGHAVHLSCGDLLIFR